MPDVVVSELHRYPVKSCRGVSLDAAEAGPRGFALDRRFMFVRASDGRFVTQRNVPAMTQVVPTLTGSDEQLVLGRAGMSPLTIDVAAAPEAGPRRPVGVWRWSGEAVDQGDDAAAWGSEALGADVRLVFQPDDVRRPVNQKRRRTPDDVVSFADGYPYLFTSTGSLAALQADVEEPVPMDRFRPNVVLDGAPAWAEDDWRELRIGAARFAVVGDCARCVIVTTDQRTGARGKQPLSTLARVRPAREGNGVIFGVNVVPVELGRVRVGDVVEVVA